MNKDTLASLSGMAPKEPEQWALDVFNAKFEDDYPKPWEPVGFKECYKASIACTMAKYPKGCGYYDPEEWATMSVLADGVWETEASKELQAWYDWRDECLYEFTRNEWPLLWAKKRYIEAEKLLNGDD